MTDQTLFDDVDRIVQLSETEPYMKSPPEIIGRIDIREGLYTLAKAVTLRPSTDHDPNPKHKTDVFDPTLDHQERIDKHNRAIEADIDRVTSSTPSPDLEKQPELPKEGVIGLGYMSTQEVALIQHLRSEGLSADKLTTYLANVDRSLYLQTIWPTLLKET